MKVLAITLARGGSKGIPNKNMYIVNGKPLLHYTIEEVKKSRLITDYYISSDNDRILDFAKKMECNTVKRPPNLATDTTTSADSLLHAYQEVIKERGKKKWDIIVEVMATNPLKTWEDIDSAIQKLIITKADSVVSVVQVEDNHPSRVKYIEDDILQPFFPEPAESRRQDLRPKAYIRNGSIYATTVKSFLENKRRLGPVTRPYIMSEKHTINIDRMVDMRIANFLLKQRDFVYESKEITGGNIYL